MLQKDPLASCSDDKHPSQDEALAIHVTLVTRPPSPQEVLPHAQTDEPQPPHLSLERTIEVLLLVYVDVPAEVRPEVLDLCADALLHHRDQGDPELIQLGLQRGQL